MAVRVGVSFARRCMAQAAKSAENGDTKKKISSLILSGYIGVTGTYGAYKGYNLRVSEDGDGDISKSAKIERAAVLAFMGPMVVLGYVVEMGPAVFFSDGPDE